VSGSIKDYQGVFRVYFVSETAQDTVHSSTLRFNLSAFCGIGVHVGVLQGVFRRCQGALKSSRRYWGCFLCQKWLRLS